jgi:hypothetical protein
MTVETLSVQLAEIQAFMANQQQAQPVSQFVGQALPDVQSMVNMALGQACHLTKLQAHVATLAAERLKSVQLQQQQEPTM